MKEEMTKKQQTIYCILVVFVLAILAFGDQLMLRSLPKNPNPNNTVFKNEEKNSYYEKEGFIKLSIDEVWQKIKMHESFYVLLLRDDCFTCELLIKKIETLKLDTPIYYLNRDDYSQDYVLWNAFFHIDERIIENQELTPFFLNFQNGVLFDTIIGNPKIEKLEQFLWKSS